MLISSFLHCTVFFCNPLFTSEILQEAGCLFHFSKYALRHLSPPPNTRLIVPLCKWILFYEINQLNQLEHGANRASCMDSIPVAGNQFLTEK